MRTAPLYSAAIAVLRCSACRRFSDPPRPACLRRSSALGRWGIDVLTGDTDDPAQALEEFLHGLHDAVELDLEPDPKASIKMPAERNGPERGSAPARTVRRTGARLTQ